MIALSEDERVRRQLALEWGVVPGWLPPRASTPEQHRLTMIKRAMRIADLKPGDVVVLAYGPPKAGPSETSFLAVSSIP